MGQEGGRELDVGARCGRLRSRVGAQHAGPRLSAAGGGGGVGVGGAAGGGRGGARLQVGAVRRQRAASPPAAPPARLGQRWPGGGPAFRSLPSAGLRVFPSHFYLKAKSSWRSRRCLRAPSLLGITPPFPHSPPPTSASPLSQSSVTSSLRSPVVPPWGTPNRGCPATPENGPKDECLLEPGTISFGGCSDADPPGAVAQRRSVAPSSLAPRILGGRFRTPAANTPPPLRSEGSGAREPCGSLLDSGLPGPGFTSPKLFTRAFPPRPRLKTGCLDDFLEIRRHINN